VEKYLMIVSNWKKLSATMLTVTTMFALSACSDFTGTSPQIAYPPPFDYSDGEELRSRMTQLSYELQQLDLALMAEGDNRPSLPEQVGRNLENIERIAGFLQEGDLSSKHPFLQSNMRNFLADVRRARMDVSASPPRYYMAGRISGACINCHRSVQ